MFVTSVDDDVVSAGEFAHVLGTTGAALRGPVASTVLHNGNKEVLSSQLTSDRIRGMQA
jgi:hypothetical protein